MNIPLAGLAFIALLAASPASAQNVSGAEAGRGVPFDDPLYVIIDQSGSMNAATGAIRKIDVAVDHALEVVTSHSGTTMLSDFAGGQCGIAARETSSADPLTTKPRIEALRKSAGGFTPLATSLDAAFRSLSGAGGSILIVTDGKDTCGGNVCEIARNWRERGAKATVTVYGVGMTPEDYDSFGCLTTPFQTRTPVATLVTPPSSPTETPLTPKNWIAHLLAICTGLSLLLALLFYVEDLVAFQAARTEYKTRKKYNLPSSKPRMRVVPFAVTLSVALAAAAMAFLFVRTEFIRALDGISEFANTAFGSSLIPNALLGAVGWLFLRYWTRNDEHRKAMQAINDEVDAKQSREVQEALARNKQRQEQEEELAAPEQQADAPQPQRPQKRRAANPDFKTYSDIVDQLKARLESLIDKIPDGRVRRKYSNIDRYNYQPIVELLALDGQLKSHERDEIIGVLDRWRQFRTNVNVIEEAFKEELRALSKRIDQIGTAS